MKISKFDKQNLKAIRAEVDIALKAISDKYGINLKIGNMSYADGRFTTKLEGIAEANKDAEQNNLKMWASVIGVDINKTFRDNMGTVHTLVKYDNKKRTAPWITQGSNGKQYKMTDEQVRRNFGGTPVGGKLEVVEVPFGPRR